jgi:hypothetical protein
VDTLKKILALIWAALGAGFAVEPFVVRLQAFGA